MLDGEADLLLFPLTADRTEGSCPHTTFLFTASVTETGLARPITFQWEGPTAAKPSHETATVKGGKVDPPPRYSYDIRGQGAASGDVVLHVLIPVDRRSHPVHIEYRCP
jgi:hypothetical protein